MQNDIYFRNGYQAETIQTVVCRQSGWTRSTSLTASNKDGRNRQNRIEVKLTLEPKCEKSMGDELELLSRAEEGRCVTSSSSDRKFAKRYWPILSAALSFPACAPEKLVSLMDERNATKHNMGSTS